MAFCWTCSYKSIPFLYWGAQNWKHHSRCGLKTAEEWGKITSFDLKDSLTSKDWDKEGTEYLSIFQVFCQQIAFLVQQWVHIFPSLPYAVDVIVGSVLVVLHVTCYGQVQVSRGFPNPIPARSDSISILVLDHLTVFVCIMHFLFMSEFK